MAGIIPLFVASTGVNIADAVKSTIARFLAAHTLVCTSPARRHPTRTCLPTCTQVIGGVADGAANEQLAGRLVGGERPHYSRVCAAHSLHLVATAGFAVPRVKAAMDRIHALAVAIKRSPKVQLELRKLCARVSLGAAGATLEELLADDE